MRENCTSGSVEGASGNGRSYSVRMKVGCKKWAVFIVSSLQINVNVHSVLPLYVVVQGLRTFITMAV